MCAVRTYSLQGCLHDYTNTNVLVCVHVNAGQCFEEEGEIQRHTLPCMTIKVLKARLLDSGGMLPQKNS